MSKEIPETQIERRLRDSLPEATAPDTLWERIETERAIRTAHRPTRPHWLFPLLTTGAVAAAALTLALLLRPAPRPTGWTYRGRQLSIGDTITADPRHVYLLREPTIGNLALLPGTRLRVVDSSKQKRLRLEHGNIKARVTAPPRLFAVETDSAIATDLGCDYELYTKQIREGGFLGSLGFTRPMTALHVKSGWVELDNRKGRVVLVPAGASYILSPGQFSLPVFDNAPEILRGLRPNVQGEWPDLDRALLAATRPRDTLTLYYLLPHVTEVESPRIWNRLLQLAPPPKSITKADLLAGNTKAIDAYEESLKEIWNPSSPEFWNSLINSIRSTK